MTSLQNVLTQIDAFVAARMAAANTPGLALAVTDREHTLAVRCYGFADIGSRTPLAPDTLLEIGSIGKTFTAIALLQEAEAGRLDLHQPLHELLPWFELPSDFAPVTPHHLLCHTGGIASGPDHTPEARYQVWALREQRAASPPSARFHYSNLGYKALGLLLEKLAGKPYPDVIAERIFAPLGLHASLGQITAAIRPRLAVGYATLYDDKPWHPLQPLVPAPFVETATGDGCIVSTAGEMSAFIRMLLGNGKAGGRRVLSEASFARMTTPFAQRENGGYGYGINIEQFEGRTRLRHGGGMPGYSAHMLCDMDDGFGVIALLNGPGSPTACSNFALACLHAWRHGEPLPELPPPNDRTRAENGAEYAGTFTRSEAPANPAGSVSGADERTTLALVADGERLFLRYRGALVALEPHGEDAFLALHPDLDGFPLRFGRDENRRVVEATHGFAWYKGTAYHGPKHFAHPPEWLAFPGRYRAHNPWVPSVGVALRKGQLFLLWTSDYDGAGGDEEQLFPLPDGSFRIGTDEGSPERVRFGAPVEGQTLELALSGSPMYRL